MLNLFKHEMMSRRTAIFGWGVALALFGAMYIAIYPQMAEQMSTLANIPIYKSMGMDMGSLKGYLASAVVQFLPILLVIYVVMSSTGTLAGEEENDTLEMLVAMPLDRRQIVLMKALALACIIFLSLLIAALGCAATFILIKSMINSQLTSSQLTIAILSAWPLLLAFAMMGLFFGAIMPTRRAASMTLTIVVTISYFGKMLAISLPSFKPVEPFFLFTHFDTSAEIFDRGPQIQGSLTLLAIALVFFIAALVAFERRDITVGLWPWQSAKKMQSQAK